MNKKRVERIWRREELKVPQSQPKCGRLWLALRETPCTAWADINTRPAPGDPIVLLSNGAIRSEPESIRRFDFEQVVVAKACDDLNSSSGSALIKPVISTHATLRRQSNLSQSLSVTEEFDDLGIFIHGPADFGTEFTAPPVNTL